MPRLWLQHFAGTSLAAEREGRLVGFMIAFFSSDRDDEGYIHFVGVAPDARRERIAQTMYERFFDACKRAGRRRVRCVTTPGNSASLRFHEAMRFAIEPGDISVEGMLAKSDYDGPGVHRIAFVRHLA